MKLKLDNFYLNVLINGLYSQRMRYDDKTNDIIDTLLLRMVNESKKLKPNRKKKFFFEPVELSIIQRCLLNWRNEQVQAENIGAVETIGELLAMAL